MQSFLNVEAFPGILSLKPLGNNKFGMLLDQTQNFVKKMSKSTSVITDVVTSGCDNNVTSGCDKNDIMVFVITDLTSVD